MKLFLLPVITVATGLFTLAAADAATLKATYEFSNSLAADESGVAALSPVDPLALNGFLTEMVFDRMDTVYRFAGNNSPASQQAGLSLNTTGLVTPNSYSLEMVFSFDLTVGYRRILDVQDRLSDNGFYVDPTNHLQVFPGVGNGPNAFTAGYHHIIMTVAANGTVKGYIDGQTDFTGSTTQMNLDNSATRTLNFFLDNNTGAAQTEYSSGKIAQARLYEGVLTDAEALTLSQTPILPEPGTAALLACGALGMLWRRRPQAGR